MERRECAAPRSTIKHLIRDSLKKHCGGVAGCPIKTMYKIWGGSKRINLEKHDDAIKEAIAELKAKNLLTEEKDVFKMKVKKETSGRPRADGQEGSSKTTQEKGKAPQAGKKGKPPQAGKKGKPPPAGKKQNLRRKKPSVK